MLGGGIWEAFLPSYSSVMILTPSRISIALVNRLGPAPWRDLRRSDLEITSTIHSASWFGVRGPLSVPSRDVVVLAHFRLCEVLLLRLNIAKWPIAFQHEPHSNRLKRMLREGSQYPFLAFGNPGFASDEHRSSPQPRSLELP